MVVLGTDVIITLVVLGVVIILILLILLVKNLFETKYLNFLLII